VITVDKLPSELVEFLEENNALQQYIDNANISVALEHNGVDVLWEQLVLGHEYSEIGFAFLWENTYEGLDYWGNLSTKWRVRHERIYKHL